MQISEIEGYELDLIRDDGSFTPAALDRFLNNKGDDFYTASKMNIQTDSRLGDSRRRRVLMHVAAFYEVCGPLSTREIDFKKINWFDFWLKKQKLKTNTIASYHASLKRTINGLIKSGMMKDNPYKMFDIKVVKTRRTVLTPAEVDKVAALEYEGKIQETLDRFLISCGTGLRFSDCYMLNSERVYEGDGGLIVDLERMKKVEFPVKNPAYRYFNGIAEKRLRKYLKDGPLFFRGTSISVQNAIDNNNLKKIALDAGINKPISFHTSRHTALTEVAFQEGNLFKVMKFGGIRKTDTALIYIHLAEERF